MNGLYWERAAMASQYRHSYRTLVGAALLGNEAALRQERRRKRYVKALARRLGGDFRQALTRQIAADFTSSDVSALKSELQTVSGRLSPILRLPAVLKAPLAADAATILKAAFGASKHRQLVESLLKDARYTVNDPRYRTETNGVRPVIIGENSATVRALAGLAHELGHCLFEHLVNVSGARMEIGSEAFAMTTEAIIVTNVLKNAQQVREWTSYQRRVDLLNFAMYALEQADIEDDPSLAAASRCLSFDRPLLLMRESLFTKPGYQAVYAKASLIRARLLRRRSDITRSVS